MKLLWLTAYPIKQLEKELDLARPIGSGGHACSWVVNLLPEIYRQLDGEIHLITTSPLVKKDQVVQKDGVIFHVLKSGIPFLHRGYPAWFPLDALYGFYLLRMKINREIVRIAPDVIHAHGTEGIYGLSGALYKTVPCMISMQGIINELVLVAPSIRFHIMAFWERLTVRNTKYFACRTHYDKGFVSSINPSSIIYELHEAINRQFCSKSRKLTMSKRILFVGTLVPWKGVDILVKAMGYVVEQEPDAELVIIGGGDEISMLKSLVLELGIDKHVSFLGVKTGEDIVVYQKESRIFVLPSRNDNSPNSLAEAMMAGMPVVATDVGGVGSMFENGISGILVPPDDAEVMAGAIIQLLKNPRECERLGRNAAELSRKRNDPSYVAQKNIESYNDIIRRETTSV